MKGGQTKGNVLQLQEEQQHYEATTNERSLANPNIKSIAVIQTSCNEGMYYLFK